MNKFILPYANVLAWCLMPNHFHLMVYVKEIDISGGATQSRTPTDLTLCRSATQSRTPTFNSFIGIMIASYTRAINKQQNTTGSLFRSKTKAECINCFKENKTIFIQSSISLTNLLSEKQYPQVCFNYIHQNPVKAGLVKNSIDWEFSSAKDYAGFRNGKLISKAVAEEYVDLE